MHVPIMRMWHFRVWFSLELYNLDLLRARVPDECSLQKRCPNSVRQAAVVSESVLLQTGLPHLTRMHDGSTKGQGHLGLDNVTSSSIKMEGNSTLLMATLNSTESVVDGPDNASFKAKGQQENNQSNISRRDQPTPTNQKGIIEHQSLLNVTGHNYTAAVPVSRAGALYSLLSAAGDIEGRAVTLARDMARGMEVGMFTTLVGMLLVCLFLLYALHRRDGGNY